MLSARQPPESGLRLSFRVRVCAKSSSAQGRDLDPGTQRMLHKYLWDARMGGVSQRRWGLLEGRPGGTGTAQQEGELKAGIAEVSISLPGQGARGQLGRGCFKIHLGREWQFGRGVGLLSPGTHSCPPCPRWWATWTPWHPTPPGRPAPPWQQGPYLGRPLGPELPAAGRCLPLAQEAALPSGKKEKKGTEKENLSAFLAQPLLPKAPGWCRLASVGT